MAVLREIKRVRKLSSAWRVRKSCFEAQWKTHFMVLFKKEAVQ